MPSCQIKRKLLQHLSEFLTLRDKIVLRVLNPETLLGDVQTEVGVSALRDSCISSIDIKSKSRSSLLLIQREAVRSAPFQQSILVRYPKPFSPLL